jgi:hypothetical protein
MKKSVLTFLAIAISLISHAAEEPLLSGKVLDEKGDASPYATVSLKKSEDSSLVKSEMTDEKGNFAFHRLHEGSYYLEIQMLGYEKLVRKNITITGTQSVELGGLALTPASHTLKAVTVQAEKPFIERQLDKTVVNVEHSPIHAGSSILEVMEKLPGVSVNQDGVISLKGKQGIVVMMDGKPTQLPAQDLGNMLRGMPSSHIQKIEIITNPSSKYDAAGNAGILNIITRKNRMQGLNGSVTAGYGQGRYEKYNTSFSLSYKNKWYNLFLTYGYAHRKGFNNLRLTRNFFSNDSLKEVFETNNYIIFPFRNHTPRAGADFTLSEKTSLSVLGSGVINRFSPAADNHTDILNGSLNKINAFDFTNRSTDRWYSYSVNTQLRHRFDTAQKELSVDLDYAAYSNSSDQIFVTVTKDAKENFIRSFTLLGDQKGNLTIYSAKADYSQPFGKSVSFETGWKSSYVKADNDIRFYNGIIMPSSLDSGRSNHFIYRENINALYASVRKEAGKTSLKAGIRTEHTLAEGEQLFTGQTFDRNYIQIFPSLFAEHKLNERHSLSMNLARRIDRPAYQQMNPFRRMIDATTYAEGNPYLLPQLTYNAELTYGFRSSFFITLGYSRTTDNITDVLIQDPGKRETIQSVVNLYRFNYYNINLSYSKKLLRWWNTNTSLLSFYGIYTGSIRNYSIDQGRPSLNISTSNSFSLTESFSLECNFFYWHQNLYGVTLLKEMYNLSLGLQKSLLKKRGAVTLNISDILWKAYPRGITNFGNVDEYWSSRRDSRVISLNFSYRFGNAQGPRMRKATGADEEKKRTGVQ